MESVNEIKDKIRERFVKVATDPTAPQRHPHGPASAKKLGYDAAEIDGLPAGVVESFAGVGNPLGLHAVRPGDTVVDIGCGAGVDSILAARKVGPSGRVVGVDMTAEMVKKATENAGAAGVPNAAFHEGEADRVPVGDATVDVVISNGVFNLCLDKPKVLAEVFRVLRPGGRLQMADILLSETVTDELVGKKGAWSDWIGGAIKGRSLLQMLADAGFTDATFHGWTGYVTSSTTQGGLVTARKPGGEPAGGDGSPTWGAVGSGSPGPDLPQHPDRRKHVVPTIRPIPDAEAGEAVRTAFGVLRSRVGAVPNMYRTLAHAPAVLDAVMATGQAIRSGLDPKLRELAYLKTTRLTDCHYWLHYHLALGQRAGLSDRQVADLDYFEASGAYSPVEKDVLRFTEQWTSRGRVDGDVLERLTAALTPEHVVILAATVGQANFTSRFNVVFGVELPWRATRPRPDRRRPSTPVRAMPDGRGDGEPVCGCSHTEREARA